MGKLIKQGLTIHVHFRKGGKKPLPGWDVICNKYIKLVSKMNAASICGWNILSNDNTNRGEKKKAIKFGVKRNDKCPLNN